MGIANDRVTLHMPLGDFIALLPAPDDAIALAEAEAFAQEMMASSFALVTPSGTPLLRTATCNVPPSP